MIIVHNSNQLISNISVSFNNNFTYIYHMIKISSLEKNIVEIEKLSFLKYN